ncbi:MAG: hypothetical protein C4K49_10615 [Candidatus Thorarchaeota archaeon]|nr:MAG: hypothetical protein C4K49_10615 [Candidatus Thorarchaeota archaeon]
MDLFERNYNGFAQSNSETMELLSKALTAGTGVDASAFTGGRALTPESLDFTLVNILFSQDEARLFQRLKKTPVKSVVRQWNTRTEVGQDDGAWVTEGGTSESSDQTIARMFAVAKYLQTYRQVTLQAAMSEMTENAMAIEKDAGTRWIIRNVEKGLFDGNSSFISEQPDGLKVQIPSTNVIDFRGGHADRETFENKITEGLGTIRASYGKGNLLLSSIKVTTDISHMLRDKYRVPLPAVGAPSQLGLPGAGAVGGVAGATFPINFPTPFGNPEVLDDVFIQEGSIPVASTLTTKCPSQPTVAGVAHGADASSKFGSADAGDYVYKVVGVNKYGDSVASAEVLVTGVAAGDKVTFQATPGVIVPTAWKIYRSKVGGTTGAEVKFMSEVAYALDSGQVYQTLSDLNADLPGCSDVYLLTLDPSFDAIEWFQFLPLMKFDLYPVNAAVYPFLMILYGAMALKKPVQHIRIKNVCPTNGGWF